MSAPPAPSTITLAVPPMGPDPNPPIPNPVVWTLVLAASLGAFFTGLGFRSLGNL